MKSVASKKVSLMNLRGFQHSLQPIQKLVHLELIFDIYLQESL